MTHSRVSGPVGAIHVDDGGQGEPTIVFVHSLGGACRQWAPQLEHVRQHARGIALDLRGHGRSDTTETAPYDLDSYAEDVAAVVDHLALERFALVGHSLGAGVTIAYAARNGARVAHLFLVDPIGDQRLARGQEVAEFLAALTENYRDIVTGYWRSILKGGTPGVQERVLEDLEFTPRRVIVESLRQLDTYDVSSAYAAYTGPKHCVITPLNDYPFSLHRLDRTLPVDEFTDVSHWLHLDKPREFNLLLDEALGI